MSVIVEEGGMGVIVEEEGRDECDSGGGGRDECDSGGGGEG